MCPGEVDENINPIGADQIDQCIVRQLPDIAPGIRVCAQALGHRVLKMKIAVQNIRECGAVAGAQDGFKKMRHGVRSKIAGNESNAQSFGLVGAGMPGGWRRGRVFQGETRPPIADGDNNLFGTDPIRTMQRHDMTGLRLQVGGIEAARCAQLLDGRIDVSARKLIQS